MHLRCILIAARVKIERVREAKRVTQAGEPGHVNAAQLFFSTLAARDMLFLRVLSISCSALSLRDFTLLYYEESVKTLHHEMSHSRLATRHHEKASGGVSLCRQESPF